MTPSDDAPAPSDESITLDTLQRDILLPQIQAFLDATTDPAAREVYVTLKTAIEAMEIALPDLQPRLGAIVEVALTERPDKKAVRSRRRAIAKRTLPENSARPRNRNLASRTQSRTRKAQGRHG